MPGPIPGAGLAPNVPKEGPPTPYPGLTYPTPLQAEQSGDNSVCPLFPLPKHIWH